MRHSLRYYPVLAVVWSRTCFKAGGLGDLHLLGKYDQPLGRGPDKVDRKAGNQGKAALGRALEHGNVLGRHDLSSGYNVAISPAISLNVDIIAHLEVCDVAEKRIAVSGNYGIA